jgi:predicted protein tyrosine phosphatase
MKDIYMEIILKLIEKLGELLIISRKRHRTLFEDHIQPIYSMVEEVTNNYLHIFEYTRKQLEDDTINLSEIVSTLLEHRKECELVRRKLEKYSKAMKRMKCRDDIEEYAYLCLWLVHVHPQSMQSYHCPGATQATSLVGELEGAMKQKDLISRKDLVIITDEYIERTKKIWSRITDIYIVLRKKMLI